MKLRSEGIAIVGMACEYPEAKGCDELWQNVLSQRRAFRKIPKNRLSEDYFSKDDNDKIYARTAAVIKDYHFDREKFRISGKNFRGADLTHWLALDIATQALEDSGLLKKNLIPKNRTGVYVGNTLTGEFSRSNVLRLRWPFIAKKVAKQLAKIKWENDEIELFLKDLEKDYKDSFPTMQEDSLAGGLANTIAGRICNYYDFHGGGYSMDGACSSSLLAVIDACRYIESGDNLISIAGGVDLSLDPFELVGFSRAGALSRREMLIYDKDSNGFWPGEGCGFVILSELNFAKENNLNIYAIIKGYGISSDGQGGLTRPTIAGQTLALQKAYRMAKYSINDVSYFEGHGTGTEVGDSIELQTIISNLNKCPRDGRKSYIGSVKANIGHTKAAAGIAGLIKAVKVVQNRLIPPVSGCRNPHELFRDSSLEAPMTTIPYNDSDPMKASVSAMGFGGINAHITLEEYNLGRTLNYLNNTNYYVGNQDSELFLFSGNTKNEIIKQLQIVNTFAEAISYSEMIDLSMSLFKKLQKGSYRAAIVASSPSELCSRLQKLLRTIAGKDESVEDKDIFYFHGKAKTKIGFLFPGQGSKSFSKGGKFGTRFPEIKIPDNYPAHPGEKLSITQPAIVGTSIIANSILNSLKIKAVLGVGHSLGEISALAWSGVLNEEQAIYLATRRGEIMETTPGIEGLMLIVSDFEENIRPLIKGKNVQIAAFNSREQTVVSGPRDEILELKSYINSQRISNVLLPLKYAFHSSAMILVEKEVEYLINEIQFHSPNKKIISSVTGMEEAEIENVKKNLIIQLRNPVQFLNAVTTADKEVDFWIEVGGDKTLQHIVKNISSRPISSISLDGNSFKGLFNTVALAWTLGNDINIDYLMNNRFSRDFNFNWSPSFFSNPCEADIDKNEEKKSKNYTISSTTFTKNHNSELSHAFKLMIAQKLELPIENLDSSYRLLDDLHLNSLEVGQLISKFASDNNITMNGIITEYANASIQEIIKNLERNASDKSSKPDSIMGIEPWVHLFELSDERDPLSSETDSDPIHHQLSDWVLIQKTSSDCKYDAAALKKLNGSGIIVDFEKCSQGEVIELLVQLIENIKAKNGRDQVVILQNNISVSGFIKSISLENPQIKFLVIKAIEHIDIETLNLEVKKNKGFSEVIYKNSIRYIPVFQPVFDPQSTGGVELTENDVILVTGGGKGITAECALALGKEYNAKLVLLGRSNLETDNNLQNNLKRFNAAGIAFEYHAVDIFDIDRLGSTIKAIEKRFGVITGFIHGAGMNRPISWHQLGISEINKTCHAKVIGFRNIIENINVKNIKLVIGFGSIIAESGMKGNADYALANEWLRQEIMEFSLSNPNCKCLNAEWSVWSGAGMGEDLGVLENLIKSGIQPISLDQGLERFLDWMKNFPSKSNLIISGRYGKPQTLNEPLISPPFFRYLEDIKLFYPGIEVIAEFVLAEHTDLYLKDHILDGKCIFPAVMGLEAMHQAAQFLCPQTKNFKFQNTEFSYPIVFEKGKDVIVRLIAVRVSIDTIKVVLRCSTTDFFKDHFETLILLDKTLVNEVEPITDKYYKPNLIVEEDLYNNLLFHKGIFKVIDHYVHLTPYHCIVKTIPLIPPKYFSDFMSPSILSFEPTIRDSALHCIQACVPNYILLPIGFKNLTLFRSNREKHESFKIEAVEILKEDNIYTYNIFIKNNQDHLIELWEEVRFKVLSIHKNPSLAIDFLSIIIQREIDELTNSKSDFSFTVNDDFSQLILKRYDCKPYIINGHISKTHLEDLTIHLSGSFNLGGDLEKVIHQEGRYWASLLGEDRYNLAKYISHTSNEELSVSATRIWGIMESIKKAGLNLLQTILFVRQESPSLQFYKCGNSSILSFYFWSKDVKAKTIFTMVLVDNIKVIYSE